MPVTPFDPKDRARAAMLAAGFHPDFPPEVLREVQSAPPTTVNRIDPVPKDLRSLLWSSIDNDHSRDLDQIEYAERLPGNLIRLLIGIADVDALVPKGSATDAHAASEATSVYTGVSTFPMLPLEYSTDRTSLVDKGDRLAVVIELLIQPGGDVSERSVYLAMVTNHAKLTYSSIGAWLGEKAPMPPALQAVPELPAQIRLQVEAASRLQSLRRQHGALTFGSFEPVPVVEDGVLKGLTVSPHNLAEDLIESVMIGANVAIAQHLRETHALSIRRVVRTPRRWDRIVQIAAQYHVTLPAEPDSHALANFLDQRRAADPSHFQDLSLSIVKLLGPGEYIVETPGTEREGHFGLAAQDYTHSTAPNRRYADLVTQRLLKAAMASLPAPYSEEELRAVAARCTDREDAARKVERLMRKVIAAQLLSGRVGESFDGIVTGASPKGTYVRLLSFPAEGRVTHGTTGLDVGDRTRVRLSSVDVPQGFIDFDRQ